MSTTLKRKMFKMGGKVDAHGVGITSGLEKRTGMNQGGRVDRGIVGYQPKDHPARQGNREGHSGYAIGNAIFNSLKGVASLGLAGKGGTINALKMLKDNPKEAYALIKQYGVKGAAEVMEMAAKARSTTGGATSYLGGNIGNAAKLANQVKNYKSPILQQGLGLNQLGGATSGIARAGLKGALQVGAGTGIGTALLSEEGNDDMVAERIARGIGKTSLDLGTGAGIGTYLGQSLRSSDENPKQTSLYNLLAGKPADKKVEDVPEGEVMSVADREEKAYAEMQTEASRKAEMMYQALNGGVNKMAAISAGLAAATPYIANEQYAEGAAAFTQGLQPEIAKDDALRQQIGGQVLSDMQNQTDLENKFVNTLIGSGDGTTAAEARRLYKADREIGLENIGEATIVNGKVNVTKPGVYVDKTGYSGKLYIAVNKDKEVEAFDVVEEAVEFSNTATA
tara:strand:+ start:4506 stop:5861 length:1356 start_codon:yes stop_codon:yes gene_type:complete